MMKKCAHSSVFHTLTAGSRCHERMSETLSAHFRHKKGKLILTKNEFFFLLHAERREKCAVVSAILLRKCREWKELRVSGAKQVLWKFQIICLYYFSALLVYQYYYQTKFPLLCGCNATNCFFVSGSERIAKNRPITRTLFAYEFHLTIKIDELLLKDLAEWRKTSIAASKSITFIGVVVWSESIGNLNWINF